MSSSNVLFEVQELSVRVEEKDVLHKISFQIKHGEVHALMGRNGSGKSSLAYTLMGHPRYHVTHGKILFNGEDITQMPTDERARKRIFLGFQNPNSIPGVSVGNFLRASIRAVRKDEIPVKDVRAFIKAESRALDLDDSFLQRSVNDGFSGGERKRLEALQLRLLNPTFAILDETDSGLDVDSLKKVAGSVVQSMKRDKNQGILLITHYQRLLNYIVPDVVHVLLDGKIVKTGDQELGQYVENRGYDWLQA